MTCAMFAEATCQNHAAWYEPISMTAIEQRPPFRGASPIGRFWIRRSPF